MKKEMRRGYGVVRALFLCFALSCVMSVAAFAGDAVELTITTDVSGTPTTTTTQLSTMQNAVSAANAAATTSTDGKNETAVTIVLNTDQLINTSPGGGTDPLFFLHGSSNALTDPPDLGTNDGFSSVTIDGNGKTLGIDAAVVGDRKRILEIINVRDEITIENLTVTGGRVESSGGTDYIGGGGLHLGAATGGDTTSKYTTAGIAPDSITLTNVKVDNNHVDITVGSTALAGLGGGAFIDATDYSGTGSAKSDVSLNSVDFTGNSVTVAGNGTGSSAIGGGVRIKNAKKVEYAGGTISGNSVTMTDGSHAAGGGIAIEGLTPTANLSGLTISGNTATVTGSGVTGYPAKAMGGGLYTYTSAGTTLTLNVSSTTFTGNKAVAIGSDVDAYGGGAFLNEGVDATFSAVKFENNEATSTNGTAWGGGLAQVGTGTLVLDGVTFTGNIAKGDVFGRGGAIYAGATGTTITNTLISQNTAEGSTAHGGGIYAIGALTMKTGTSVIDNTALGNSTSTGGGIFAVSTVDMDGGTISGNMADGLGAYGGGIFVSGALTTINGTSVIGNTAQATGTGRGGGIHAASTVNMDDASIAQNTASGGTAQGGGIYAWDDVTLTNTSVTGNTATGTTAQGGGIYAMNNVTLTNTSVTDNTATGTTAQGGGIYAMSDVTLTNTSVTDNSVTGSTTAQGGGIYMDTSYTSSVLTIAATAGNTVNISGNKAGGDASGIFFGGNGTTNGELLIQADGIVNLLDPVNVNMTGGSFSFSSNGSGTLVWGGANTFNVTGGATLDFNSGMNYLTADYTATAGTSTDFSVDIASGATLQIDGSRNATSALFTYAPGNTNSSFTVDSNANIKVDLSAKLMDGTFTYLVANNYATGNTDAFAGMQFIDGNYTSTLTLDGTNIVLTTVYKSLYSDVMAAADPNTRRAIDSLALADKFETLTDEQRAQLASGSNRFNNATPGWLMNGVSSGLNTLVAGADAARSFGLTGAMGNSGYMGMAASSDRGLASLNADGGGYHGARFWTGYIGDFDRTDGSDGYYGYRADRHGVLFGLNYDAGSLASIGLYGGYSHTKTTARGLALGEIKSDTGHVGLIGRLSPFREVPAFALFADAGYTFSNNDSVREEGILRTTGNYDQKYYTVGLEAQYSMRFGGLSLNPFVAARYVNAKQDAFTETGALASHVGSVNADVFNTRVGASVGYDIETGFGVVRPSVSVAWRHEFGDRQYSANAFYQGVATPINYTVRSTRLDRDSMDVGGAIRALLRDDEGGRQMGLNLGYNLNLSKNRDNHSLYAGFDLTF